MAKAFAVDPRLSEEPPAEPISVNVISKTITVHVEAVDSDTFTVNLPYLSIPEATEEIPAALLTWELDAPANWTFDTPGIIFIGGAPNIVRAGDDPRKRHALWVNSPEYRQRSFAYRVMLLRHDTDAHGNDHITPVSLDPTVHNDPPSAM